MPFCGKCGRKLRENEVCSCSGAEEISAAKLGEEFFSSVGKAIEEAEDTPLFVGDEDMKILPEKTKLSDQIKRKIDDANRFAETRPFSLGEEAFTEEGEDDVLPARRVDLKKLAILSAAVIVIAALLFFGGKALLGSDDDTDVTSPVIVTMDGANVVVTKLSEEPKAVAVDGDTVFYENKVTVLENKERVFFFAEGGEALYYLNLTGDWYRQGPVLIDDGFAVQTYYAAPDGRRLLYQKEENGPLVGAGLSNEEKVTVASRPEQVMLDGTFTYLTFVEDGSLYEVRLDLGWQKSFVAQPDADTPVFGGEGKVYFLLDGALCMKKSGKPYQVVAENITGLCYRQGEEVLLWDPVDGIQAVFGGQGELFAGDCYFTAADTGYLPLTDFILEEDWEALSVPASIHDIVGLRWELPGMGRYLIVTEMSGTEATLQYACFDDAEGAYMVYECNGYFSTPETIAFTVEEQEGTVSYSYQLYFKVTETGSSVIISGEADRMVVRGEYYSDEGGSMTSGNGWQKDLIASLEGKSYPVAGNSLYYIENETAVLLQSSVASRLDWAEGMLYFYGQQPAELPKLQLSTMEELDLSGLMALLNEALSAGGEEGFLAVQNVVYPLEEAAQYGDLFAQDGLLFCFADNGDLLWLEKAGEALQSTKIADNVSEVCRMQSEGEGVYGVFFRETGLETGKLSEHSGGSNYVVAENAYLDSCVWPDETNFNFYYEMPGEKGRQLWCRAGSVPAAENIAGRPLFVGEKALVLTNMRAGKGEVVLFDAETKIATKVGEASQLLAFR